MAGLRVPEALPWALLAGGSAAALAAWLLPGAPSLWPLWPSATLCNALFSLSASPALPACRYVIMNLALSGEPWA